VTAGTGVLQVGQWSAGASKTVPQKQATVLPVRLLARPADELDARLAHPVVLRTEVVDPQEHADATRELVSHRPRLALAVGARE
jgi:hypothetical protein